MSERALLDLRVSSRGINVVRSGFRNLDKELAKAIRRAVYGTSKRIKKEVDASFVKISGIKASVIRNRLFVKIKASKYGDGGYFSTVWVGLNPISLSKLNPVETAGGVRAGKLFIPDAFMPKGKFGNAVFTRRFEGQRLPWDKQFYHFDAEMMQEIAQNIMPQVQRIFNEQFQTEVIGLFYERSQATKLRARERQAQIR